MIVKGERSVCDGGEDEGDGDGGDPVGRLSLLVVVGRLSTPVEARCASTQTGGHSLKGNTEAEACATVVPPRGRCSFRRSD